MSTKTPFSFRLRDPFTINNALLSFALFMSYVLTALGLAIGWLFLVISLFSSPFPIGLPALLSPAVLFAAWKGIERT